MSGMQQKTIFDDREEEQVRCHACGNDVNKAQIHDREGVCMGCFYRRQDDTYTDHDNLSNQDYRQSKGENQIENWKKQVEDSD